MLYDALSCSLLLPEPAVGPSAFTGAVISRPICNDSAFATAAGLMRHITIQHAGVSLSQQAVDV